MTTYELSVFRKSVGVSLNEAARASGVSRTRLWYAERGAAGGLAYLSECQPEEKQWARKRFIEAYMRWEELQRDYALLPEGEFKVSLKALAEAKSMPQLSAGKSVGGD